ncbi:MAG: RodZ domain-containing protein [Candidatus Omnitrophota bacterium]
MEPIGERIKKARLEKGLTLEDVHRKTKIHLNVLKSIEEGSLVNFNPVYIKGFLKIYCKFLGVEYSDSGISAKTTAPVAARPTQEKHKPSLPAVNVPPLLTEAVKFIRGKSKQILFTGLIIIAIIGLFKFGKFINLKIRQMPKKPAAVKPVQRQPLKQEKKKETTAAKPAKAEKPAAAAAAAPKPQKPEDNAAAGIRLGIRAKEDCWTQVKIDGKTVFQSILKKGRFENWQAKNKIELSLGNAGVVELEVNGKFISSLGRRGQSVKNILITKDGLTTPR